MYRASIPLLVFLTVFVAPTAASAAVFISEIMYDPSGTDTKHEWIEVMNSGEPIVLSDWKLFEGGVNHSLNLVAGAETIPSGTYVVIADDPTTFLADYPGFSGTLFDVAFTSGLNNTNGESIAVRDNAGADIDSVTYTPGMGGAGDGTSLQKNGSSWVALQPTPGGGPGAASEETEVPETSTPSSVSASSSPSTSSFPVDPKIRITAGDDRTAIVGAPLIFSSVVYGLAGERIESARVVWSFGDGTSAEGQSVAHTFLYPGSYTVVADAASGAYSAADRVLVAAVPADLSFGTVSPELVEIKNHSSHEVDLGGWILSADGSRFVFPPRTIVRPQTLVAFAGAVTGVRPSVPSTVLLQYPNGMPAVTYTAQLMLSAKSIPRAEQEQQSMAAASGLVLGASAGSSDGSRDIVEATTTASPRRPLPYWVFVFMAGLLGTAGAGAYLLVSHSKTAAP